MTHSLDPETSHAPDHADHVDHAPGQGVPATTPTTMPATMPATTPTTATTPTSTAPAAPLADAVLAEEIELYTDVVVAATESDGPLPEGELDRVLGVEGGPADA